MKMPYDTQTSLHFSLLAFSLKITTASTSFVWVVVKYSFISSRRYLVFDYLLPISTSIIFI